MTTKRSLLSWTSCEASHSKSECFPSADTEWIEPARRYCHRADIDWPSHAYLTLLIYKINFCKHYTNSTTPNIIVDWRVVETYDRVYDKVCIFGNIISVLTLSRLAQNNTAILGGIETV